MTHDAVVSTISELSGKIICKGMESGPFVIGITRKDDGTFSALLEFGEEAKGSPMYGGASYGIGDSADEALRMIARELGLLEAS